MNERIRELADQAELTIRTSIGTYMSHPEFNKKFAELIVQECVGITKHHVMNISTYADADFVEKQILKHFGVEQ